MRIILIFVFLLSSFAVAQNKKTLAMGVFGEEGAKFKALKPLKLKLSSALSTEGKFKVTDRSNEILKLLRKDYEYQEGTSVADDDAMQIGELFKSGYVCIVESTSTGDGYFSIDAKLVDVSAEESSIMASARSKLLTQQEVNQVADELVSQLLKRTGGIFIDSDYKMSKLSQEFANVLKKKITFKNGSCGANSIVVQINASEPVCEGSNSISCNIDVTLDGAGCTNEAELHLKGTVRATDKTENAAIAVAKKELLGGKADFIKEWLEELEPWKRK